MAAKRSAGSKKLDVVSSSSALSKNQLLDLYEMMILMRRFEERVANVYQQGLIRGFCHLYTGQEAVLAGIKAAAIEGDDYITSYRCHAQAIACGVSPEAVMAELMGRATGISKGKGGSMHMFEPEKGYWGGHGIVAAQTPLGAGIAFAHKYRGNKNVCYTFVGDGAMNAGQVFETFNMSALWKLPVLFIIENNQYGMGTAVPRAAAGELYKRGEPFGIPGKKVDGQDFFAVYEAVKEANDYIRAGNGPAIIEMDTYRYRGHSMSDPAKYRTREEVDGVKQNRDPIANMGAVLLKDYGVSEADLDKRDKAAKEKALECVEYAKNSPWPDESELTTEVIPE